MIVVAVSYRGCHENITLKLTSISHGIKTLVVVAVATEVIIKKAKTRQIDKSKKKTPAVFR